MTRPDGGDGEEKDKAKEGFDQVWGALVDSASDKEDDSAQEPNATKPWTEEVRGERKRDAAPSPSASSSVLLGPDPDRLHETADEEMARLMSGEAEAEPDDADEPRRVEPGPRPEPDPDEDSDSPNRTFAWVAGAAAVLIVGYLALGRDDAPSPPTKAPAVAKDEAPRGPADGALASAKRAPDPEAEPADVRERGSATAERTPDGGGDDEGNARASTAPGDGDARDGDAPDGDARGDDGAPPDGDAPRDGDEPGDGGVRDGDATPPAGDARDADAPGDGGAGDGDAPGDGRPRVVAPPEIKRSGDPRGVPEGTPPANAAAFRKLPVSPADLPPVGAVGVGGVHVDRIGMGSSFEKTRCAGKGDAFSASGDERVNVCLRVVHPRQKEELVVLWQRDGGGTVRRGKVVVKPAHAYRTRAYLILRREYVGKWKVRILDQEGAELASHPFTVVE